MRDRIERFICQTVRQARGRTSYRRPLVGFARADDPLFAVLKEAVGPDHLLPQDILPEAATVVAFFVPFTRELVKINKRNPYVSREWAEAYIETNRLISACCAGLTEELTEVKAAWQPPTYNFDPVRLRSRWSHKHVAFICGLGTFGVHRMLITPYGSAGRLGSLVIDRPVAPSPRPAQELCRYKRTGKCLLCVNSCPTGALTPDGLDKAKCYGHLLEVDAHFAGLGLCDVCGKCATGGPCAATEP